MRKKTKKRTKEKKSVGKKILARRTNAIESALKKLQRISKKIITRQKRDKGHRKQLAKGQKGLQRRLDGVDARVGKQLRRIRDLAEKNGALRKRLKKQARLIKDNCSRLDRIEPTLKKGKPRSKKIERQISDLLALIENVRGHSKELEQGLASLELRVARQIEALEAPGPGALYAGETSEAGTDEGAPPPQFLRLDESPAEAAEWADEQQEWLRKLQTRLEVLENDYTALEEGNLRLGRSIEALGDRESERDDQNNRIIQQNETLGADQAEQQKQITSLNEQIFGIQNRVKKLTQDMPDGQRPANLDAELQQQLNDLQQGMEALQAERRQTPEGLSEAVRQQLHETGDRERSLRQQIDQLGGLLVTTEGKLTEKNAHLGLEQARLAEQVQQLEQRLRNPETAAVEPWTQELQSLRELNQALQRRLREIGEGADSQKQQIDYLGSLLKSSENKWTDQDTRLGMTDRRLAEQSQRVEQRLAALEGSMDERLTEERQALQGLSNTLKQQLREASDSKQSLAQQIDHLGNRLLTTEGKIGEQNKDISSLDDHLKEQANRLAGLEGTVGTQQAQELTSLKERSEALQQRLRETGDRERSLIRKVDDLEALLATTGDQQSQQQTKLANQISGLASGHQAIEAQQKRLVGGLIAGGLLILALGLAGYWLKGQQIAQSETASQRQIDEIRQQLLSRGALPTTGQEGALDSAARLEEFAVRMTALESGLQNQDQRFALLDGQADNQPQTDTGALDTLRRELTRQEQWISQHQNDMDQLRETVKRLEAAQKKTEKSLEELLDTDLSSMGYPQGSVDAREEETASEISGAKLRGSSWLRGLNPDHYTIQLVAAHNRAVIRRVAASLDSTEGLAYYKGRYQGRDWYVLLYGDFETMEQALSAGLDLPEQIRAFKPWVRRLAWVHRDLTER